MPAFEAIAENRTVIYPIEPPVIMPAILRQIKTDEYELYPESYLTVIDHRYGSRLDDEEFDDIAAFFEEQDTIEYDVFDVLLEAEIPELLKGQKHPSRALVALVSAVALSQTVEQAQLATGILRIPLPFPHLLVATHDHKDNKDDEGSTVKYNWKNFSINSLEEWSGMTRLYVDPWLRKRAGS